MSLSQLSRLLPLPESELQQVLEYAATLSKHEAVEHFSNLLGDSPQVVDFISSFNSQRADPGAKAPAPTPAAVPAASAPAKVSRSSDIDAVPKPQRGSKKKRPLHTPAPRQVIAPGPAPGSAYNKKNREDDYISGRPGTSTPFNGAPSPTNQPVPNSATPPPPRPSAAGTLVSELGLPKPKPKPRSTPASRSSTPGPNSRSTTPATKISIAGGTPMQGASTALADLDDAIRTLEATTNPTHASNSAAGTAARRCNCVAARHPLQTAAPNCLSCGKVVCVKEGLGPCTSCGAPLLGAADVQTMIRELREERGREKMVADRGAHRRAAVAGPGRSVGLAGRLAAAGGDGGGSGGGGAAAEARAREHRDRLLGFQAQNARRTTVRDEAADFDATVGGSIWASPEERARELKRQQKMLREMEWNARPDYEKRRQVVSIDLVGGKIVKKMAAIERPPSPEDIPDDADGAGHALEELDSNRTSGGGAFSRNPLLGGVIKPVYDAKGKGTELEGRRDKKTRWRRVQDDLDNNEAVILDGGIYGGGGEVSQTAGWDEPNCG